MDPLSESVEHSGMRKSQEIYDPNSCLNKAKSDEPIFVIRGQDALAVQVIAYWISLGLESGVPEDKLLDAFNTALAMKAWPNRKVPD